MKAFADNLWRWRGHMLCLLLCCAISLAWGLSLQRTAGGLLDFRALYYGARCVMEHHDPYNATQFEHLYLAENGSVPSGPQAHAFKHGLYICINLPTTLLLVAPLAMLTWSTAHLLWIFLTVGLFALAATLIWIEGRSHSPLLALLAVCFVAANAEILIAVGNSAGIVVSFCVLASWCFVNKRCIPPAVVCLGIALAVKPHDAGPVWLYFVLLGGVYRKRALQALVMAAILAAPSVIWVSNVAPDWAQEMHANVTGGMARGGINEPGPDSIAGTNAGMVISLQAAINVFTPVSRVYDTLSYLVCGAMLLVWALHMLRVKSAPAKMWLGLAAVVAPTLLITYHRTYDAKLILLVIPACAMLWSKRGFAGWLAMLSTMAAILFTADIPLTVWIMLRNHFAIGTSGIWQKAAATIVLEPTPLILLAMGVFYLWAYVKSDAAATTPERYEGSKCATLAAAGALSTH